MGCGGSKPPEQKEDSRDTKGAAPIVDFLRSVPLFNSLGNPDLQLMGKRMLARNFKAGQNVIQQGEDGDEFFVIVDGEAKVTVEGQGMVYEYHAGDFFGERAILRKDRRAATVTATAPLKVLVLTHKVFDELQLRDKVSFPQRQAVQAERLDVYADTALEVVPKDAAALAFIKDAIMHEDVLHNIVELNSTILQDLADVAVLETCPKGKKIISFGETDSQTFYIIAKGSVENRVPRGAVGADNNATKGTIAMHKENSETGGYKTLSTQKAGECFGAVALLYGVPRASAVVAREDCELWTITRRMFKVILMRARALHLDEYITFMDKVEGLGTAMGQEEKRAVAQALTEVVYHKGDTVISEGEEGNCLYIVYKGELEAFKNDEMVKHYTPGGYFGERALLNMEPRAATIKCMTDDCTLLMIDRDSFNLVKDALKDGHPRGTFKHLMVRKKTEYFGLVPKENLKHIGYIGAGGFGFVSLEEDKTNPGDIYALKALSKGHLVNNEMCINAILEKDILMMCDSPFIIRLHNTYKDANNLYFLLEACLLGDLYLLLSRHSLYGKRPCAAFYSAVVVEAFAHLHDQRVVYRDLKPENLLMKQDGTCKLCDMGIAKVSVGKTFTLCGTPEYMAPEVIQQKGHSHAVDWWCLGVFVHELIVGATPFAAASTWAIYKAVNKGIEKINFPAAVTADEKQIIIGLCNAQPSKRTPMLEGGRAALKGEQLWKDLNWQGMADGTQKVPYMPPKVTPAQVVKNRVNKRDVEALQVKYKDPGTGWENDF